MVTRLTNLRSRLLKRAFEALKEALKGSDAEDIKAKTEELAKASHKLAEHMYADQQQQGEQPGEDGAGDGGAQEGNYQTDDQDVEDADYEVVDDDDSK
jgi:molecular chaperone DnaK